MPLFSVLTWHFNFCLTENVNILGSDDTTTCIIVVVRHSGKLHNNFITNISFLSDIYVGALCIPLEKEHRYTGAYFIFERWFDV